MILASFLIGVAVLFSQSSFVSAQTTPTTCIPSTGACVQTGVPQWEFDAVKKICYQPLAQCGGTQFATGLDCQTACLGNTTLTPTAVPTTIATPTVVPTTSDTPTPAPTEATSPTVEPTPLTTITPTEGPSCSQSKGDANNDGKATLRDYEIFRQEYSGEVTTLQSDFNCDGKVTLTDFEIFRDSFTS